MHDGDIVFGDVDGVLIIPKEIMHDVIERALEKWPVSTTTVENLAAEIEDQAVMQAKSSREISTSDLGELVLQHLNDIDKVAYIRFASVYKHFENLEEFINEVNKVGGIKK